MEKRMPLTRIIALITFATLMMAGTVQAAGMYKWTDAEGNVHYSQTPPEDQQADKVHIKDSAPLQDSTAGETDTGEQDNPAEDAQNTPEAKQRQKNCEIARYNLETYKSSDRLKQPDGKVIVISDEMRDAKLKEAQSLIDIYCK
jgi:hypothetical protein